LKYEIKRFDGGGRIGLITHNGKQLVTPNLLPVVSPFDNIIPPKELYSEFGIHALFTNAYILYNNVKHANSARQQGIHSYLEYPGLIATDSGAFQHYMYGKSENISAEEIEGFQEEIKADFPVILDIPVQLTDTKQIAFEKVTQTLSRANDNVNRRTSEHGAWYGPLHGTLYLDVLKKSCEGMNSLEFGVYAIGGIVKALNDYAFDVCIDVLLTVKKYIRKDKPIHMFGLGLPQFFSLAVAAGADLMDSAAYVLFAKEGRYFTLEGTRHISDLTELPCSCPICISHTAQEINSLFKERLPEKTEIIQNKGIELISRHNLYVSMGELKSIREAIRSGNLWEFVEQRIQSHPKLIKAYQKIPLYWKDLETQIPIEKKKGKFLKGAVSFSQPIFYRTTHKILNLYRISNHSTILLLPEFGESLLNSSYGREWIDGVERIKTISPDNIEPLIISSYFGIIPLDLYGIYPFSQREWVEPPQTNSLHFSKMMNFSQDSKFYHPLNLILSFLQKNHECISQVKILRPNSQIDIYNQEIPLAYHFVDDVITILKEKSKEIFCSDIKIEVFNSLEDWKMNKETG